MDDSAAIVDLRTGSGISHDPTEAMWRCAVTVSGTGIGALPLRGRDCNLRKDTAGLTPQLGNVGPS